jgi:hypothetical protein
VIDFDRYVLAACMTTFGEFVLFYSGTQPPQTVRAVFDERHRETTYRDGGEVTETRPMLGLRESVLLGSAPPVQGDLFSVRGRYYVVSNPPRQDGQGHLAVPLRFATDDEARLAPIRQTT